MIPNKYQKYSKVTVENLVNNLIKIWIPARRQIVCLAFSISKTNRV